MKIGSGHQSTLVTMFPEQWERGTGLRNEKRQLEKHGTRQGILLILVPSITRTCSQKFRNEDREQF
jgi:hypothetical protein